MAGYPLNGNMYNPYIGQQQQLYYPDPYGYNISQQQQQNFGQQQIMQNLNPPSQPQPQAQVQLIQGRVIKNAEEIVPSEIPMNGSTSFFPLADGSCIFTKTWNGKGTIDTNIYTLYIPPKEEELEDNSVDNNNNIIFNTILERLDNIEKMIVNKTQQNKKTYNNKNKNQGQQNAEQEMIDNG